MTVEAMTPATGSDAPARGIAFFSPLTFADALAMERRMLECIGATDEEARLRAAVWQTQRSIVLPSGMSRRPGIDVAERASEIAGWPVFERFTGGDVTPQFEGVLNISLGFALSGSERNIEAAYRRLTDPLVTFLKNEFGIHAYTSSVDGAFCDGAFNLVVEGRKLAGTAQRWRLVKSQPVNVDADALTPQRTAVLAHAALLLGHDLDNALKATNAFFAAWGSDRRVDSAAHVTIADLAGAPARDHADFASRLAGFLSEELGALPPPQS
ncbi:MAG: hypothetical protein APF80_09105 [Alphaproteobacteria bacterium BRH_c36]|nr:MAG: hypothetical protein APF80_09105 [Alphaproteobacteria bacterium BRH_c36]